MPASTFRSWLRHIPLLVFLLPGMALGAAGELSDNQRITSEILGYDLQYRVYRPAGSRDDDRLPSLYVTDAHKYLQHGNMVSVLDKTIADGLIEPLVVVFVDSRNPDRLEVDRRNKQFMCNTDYAAFFANELIPSVSTEQPVSESRDDRAILGLSFGGLNSACFGLMLPDLFSGIAMQSPASAKHVDVVRDLYEEREALPLKMFLSVGTMNDNQAAVKQFRRVLKRKGYDLTYRTVREGHNWKNWGPLLDDVLVTFFAAD
tara:strand:+ start:7083 stop:7862 length:780 start_codon:yes stop_codon:yes gene_type:complete